MGKPSTKQSTNSTQTTNLSGTARAYAPDWITTAAQGATKAVTDAAGHDPLSYTPDANALLTQAGAQAGGLTGTPWNYSGAEDLTNGVAHANAPQTAYVDSSKMIGKFLNPYLDSVVNATSADLDHSDNIARQQSELADPSAFGGSGIALTKSAMEDALSRARATSLGGLRSQGFTTALDAAQSEAGRRQSANDINAQLMGQGQDRTLTAAGQIANIASQFGDQQRADVAAQTAAGSVLQGISDKRAQAPLDLAAWQSSNLPQILQKYFGSDTTGTQDTVGSSNSKTATSDPMATIGQVAQIAALFSDERLKCDIERVGERPDGIGIYLYRYVWSLARCFGVLAQDVLKIKPEAVSRHATGYLMVDYGRI
jgi:hypothetical protein